MFWLKVEKIVGETIPKCVKKILVSCGYDTIISLKNISSESVIQMENHINMYARDVIQQLDCCNHDFYKNQQIFKLLPGHRDCILSLPKLMSQELNSDGILIQAVEKHTSLSVMLRELVKTGIQNGKQAKNRAQYSDIIRYFATYIFILCGRSCYEVLYENLPLPSVKTLCK